MQTNKQTPKFHLSNFQNRNVHSVSYIIILKRTSSQGLLKKYENNYEDAIRGFLHLLWVIPLQLFMLNSAYILYE